MTNTAQAGRQTDTVQAQRKLKNYLIDSKFQMRWVTRIIFIITVIVGVMGYFLYRTVADSADQMLAQKLGDLELTEASINAFVAQTQADKLMTVYKLAAWLFALAVFVSGAIIVLTHKVAGPVYKMRKIFRSIDDDNLSLTGKLRKGDELREAFDDFDDMLRRLREQRRADLAVLEGVRDSCKDSDTLSKARSDLDALIKKFEESVRMDS